MSQFQFAIEDFAYVMKSEFFKSSSTSQVRMNYILYTKIASFARGALHNESVFAKKIKLDEEDSNGGKDSPELNNAQTSMHVDADSMEEVPDWSHVRNNEILR